MLAIRAGMNIILVSIANRRGPDQTTSTEAVCSGSALFVCTVHQINAEFLWLHSAQLPQFQESHHQD